MNKINLLLWGGNERDNRITSEVSKHEVQF